jgi:hypothetical protein
VENFVICAEGRVGVREPMGISFAEKRINKI